MEIDRTALEQEVAELLGELVSIPSINPVFQTAGQPADWFGEERLAAAIESWALRHRIQVERQPVLPGRENVLLHVPGTRPGHLLWEAHMDTVQVENMRIAPFAGTVRGGRLYGRGAADTKASLCAMMAALRLVHGEKDRPSITLAATVDEEYQYRGVLALLEGRHRFDAGVVGEPTDLQVVVAHKGCIRFKLATIGRAAHSSRPEDGVNAIEAMGLLIRELMTRSTAAFASRRHPLVGQPTLTVTQIEGGLGGNTVPDRCEIVVDRRLNPDETPEGVFAEVTGWIEEIQAMHPGLQVKIERPFVSDVSMEIAEDERIASAMRQGCLAAGLEPQTVGVPFGTDASKLVRAGTPCVVFGPGSIEEAHASEESVPIGEVVDAARALVRGSVAFGLQATDGFGVV